jgi:CRP/FNR family transcriptional regulator, cyclic AMP receptor protein
MAIHEQADRDLLSALPDALAAVLLANARPVRIAGGDRLFAAGEAGNGCYRVNQGLLKVTVMFGEDERILAVEGPGSIIVELSLFDGGPRSASVTAVRDSQLSFISRTHFESFSDRYPQLYRHLLPLLAQRLRGAKAATDDNFLLT